ncbi:hypothetical protein V8D89_016094 [Ganoderma adspersum]
MSNTSSHLVVLPDISPERVPPLEGISGNAGTTGCPPKPETSRRNPSRAPTRTPSPRDDHHIQDPSLRTSRPSSSASVPSTATLSGIPSSSIAENVGDITGDPLVAEPESLGRKHGAVWLAPSPVTILTGMRYSRREKLSRNYSKGDVIKKVPPMNGIEPRPERLGSLG